MWVFTVDGFLSAVQEKKRGPHYGQIVVRAREKKALVALRKVAPTLTDIEAGAYSDYRYRAWLGREEWAAALAELGRRVDYGNFKDAVFRKQGHSRYEAALHSVWSILGRIQPGGPYGWGGKGHPAVPKGEPTRKQLAPGEKEECFYCGIESSDVVSAGEGRWACRKVGPCVDRERKQAAAQLRLT